MRGSASGPTDNPSSRSELRPLNFDPFSPEILRYYHKLNRVSAFVQERLPNPVSLADGARAAGLGVKYFSAFFRSKVGMGFSRWIRDLRCEQAADALRNADCSILHAARVGGFSDIRTFERAFKHHFGLSPAAFRKAVRPKPRIVTHAKAKTPRRKGNAPRIRGPNR